MTIEEAKQAAIDTRNRKYSAYRKNTIASIGPIPDGIRIVEYEDSVKVHLFAVGHRPIEVLGLGARAESATFMCLYSTFDNIGEALEAAEYGWFLRTIDRILSLFGTRL